MSYDKSKIYFKEFLFVLLGRQSVVVFGFHAPDVVQITSSGPSLQNPWLQLKCIVVFTAYVPSADCAMCSYVELEIMIRPYCKLASWK